MAMSAALVSSGYVNRRFVAFVGCVALREERRKKSRTHGFGPRSIGFAVNSPGVRMPSQGGCMDHGHVENNQKSE